MYKVFMLTIANIRKSIGNTISLLIMFIIASLLLNAGLLVSVNFNGYFEKTIKDLNTTNTFYILSSNLYNDEVENLIKNDDNVIEHQKEESIWFIGKSRFNDDERELTYIINDASAERNLSKWKIVGNSLTPDDNSIYLPSVFNQSGGYELNDSFEIKLNDTIYTFKIKGFTEDILFSSIESGLLGIYLPHETYVKFSSEISDEYNATVIFCNVNDINKELETKIKELTKAESLLISKDFSNAILSLELPLIKLSRVLIATMVAMFIVVFAVIIVLVSLLVIKFRIGNSILDDMTKIGTLKAIGYTSRQIIFSIIMQFILIAFVGCVVGISLSYSSTPMLSDVFAAQSGLRWEQGFDPNISFMTLVLLLLIVLFVSLISARRINKLDPIVALRQGLLVHSFKKNHLPLNKSRGSLSVVLGLKSMLNNLKQSIMIMIILVAVGFAGTFAVVMFYNTTIDTRTFAETPGVELSNVAVTLKPQVDRTSFQNLINQIDGVRKTLYQDEVLVLIDKVEVILFVMDDYSEKETDTIYEGRYPNHANEIAISGHLADMINKNIGDTIIINLDSKQEEYLVTGFTQGSYLMGMHGSIRTDGINKIAPDFVHQKMQIYLHKGVDSGIFSLKINEIYGESLLQVIDVDKLLDQGIIAYTSIVSKLGIGILIVTIALVILVLYFVINSSLIRRKRELGIQKAIGFTTFQLMNQVSLSYIFPIVLGVIFGSIIGITQTNALMSMAQRGMAIMKANYIITPIWIALIGLLIVIISYFTSMLLTAKIRKISAYNLVIE